MEIPLLKNEGIFLRKTIAYFVEICYNVIKIYDKQRFLWQKRKMRRCKSESGGFG